MKFQQPPSTPRGFTLIEMMVTIAIAGVLAALATAGYAKAIDQEKVKTEAVAVRSALLEARNTARTTLNCVRVDVAAQSITITQILSCTGLDIDGLGTPAGTDAATTTYTFAPKITLQPLSGAATGSTFFFFNPKGGLPYETPVILDVKSTAENRVIYRYRISPGVGDVVGSFQ